MKHTFRLIFIICSLFSGLGLADESQPPELLDPAHVIKGTNQTEIIVFAEKRSGHHAILNWILKQVPGPVYYLQNAFISLHASHYRDPDGSNQFRYKLVTAGQDSQFHLDGLMQKKSVHRRDISSPFKWAKDWVEKIAHNEAVEIENWQLPLTRDLFLMNFEDFDLENFDRIPWNEVQRGQSNDRKFVVILRDPYNLAASRIKKGFPVDQDFIRRWKAAARLATGNKNILLLNYNRWFQDLRYRKKISQKLGLEFSDAGLQTVVDYGDGSSFDGLKFDGIAQKMQVLCRWQQMRHDPKMSLVLNDSELRTLSQKIFGTSVQGL